MYMLIDVQLRILEVRSQEWLGNMPRFLLWVVEMVIYDLIHGS